ncbi:cation:proton antiporter [Clostridium mediterraneense]|uniref:cation:proton antiporter n=1 Tax=Clostridium mediterraneense TaxID=1805472 RepID=UPI00082B19D0|nr:cation:proton antiporter [Clostridium mediterraneense]
MSHNFLLDLALILISTKLLGLLTKKLQMPQVVGALLAGLILGPSFLNILKDSPLVEQLSSLGVIVLMFAAGLEADVTELKKSGKASLIAAILGIILPLLGGFLIATLFHEGVGPHKVLKNVFIGIILTATSVSITVETLKELGKISTRAGNTILGAALIDDILGIIALTIVTSMADSSVSIGMVLFKIVAFFVVAAIIAFVFRKLFVLWFAKRGKEDLRRFVVIPFALCLFLAYIAEHYFGVADITGAFIAGMIVSNTEKTHYINGKMETLSFLLLSPIFFASIGLKLELGQMDSKMIWFTVALIVVAIITKIIGCGLGTKLCGYSNRESLQVGTGMVSRGEVALIVASNGMSVGLMADQFLAPVVIMVVFTTIVAPIILKLVFKDKKEPELKKAK